MKTASAAPVRSHSRVLKSVVIMCSSVLLPAAPIIAAVALSATWWRGDKKAVISLLLTALALTSFNWECSRGRPGPSSVIGSRRLTRRRLRDMIRSSS